jgi:hypothetical protein
MTLKNGETFAILSNLTGLNIPTITNVTTPTGTFKFVSGTDNYVVGALTYNITETAGALTGIGFIGQGSPTVLIKEEKDNANPQVENVVRVPTLNSSVGVDIGVPVFSYANAGTSGYSMADSHTMGYVDYYGTYVTKYAPSGGSNAVVVTLAYPDQQMYANLFIAPVGAIATSTSTSGAVSLNPISVGMAVLDSTVTTLEQTCHTS